jgi:hypothetical protein
MSRTTAYDATRETRFRVAFIQQGANGYRVACHDRATGAAGPPLQVDEADLSAKVHEKAIAFFAALEEAYERHFLGWAAEPARQREAVAAAVEAEQRTRALADEARRLDAEMAAKRAELAKLEAAAAKARRETRT